MQVLQTNRQISQAGKTVWNHTKRQTDRALDRPKRLLAMLNGGSKEADESDDDVEGAVLNTYRCSLAQPFESPRSLVHVSSLLYNSSCRKVGRAGQVSVVQTAFAEVHVPACMHMAGVLMQSTPI